jgi:hypothetical protein
MADKNPPSRKEQKTWHDTIKMNPLEEEALSVGRDPNISIVSSQGKVDYHSENGCRL